MKNIVLILAGLAFLTASLPLSSQIRKEEGGYTVNDKDAAFVVSMPKRVKSLALHPSYISAAKDAEDDIIPSFEQIGLVGKTAFEKVKASASGLLADESNFLEQVFSPAPAAVIDDLTQGGRLSFTNTYKKRLEEAFHTKITAGTKERPKGSAGEPAISPRFSVEPVPSYYLQMGDAFGGVERAMKKAAPLTRKMREFFYAMHVQSLHDVGLARRADSLPPADEFLRGWRALPEMDMDIRTVTPIGPADPKDLSAGTRYWAVLGVEALTIEAAYDKKPLAAPLTKGAKADIGWTARRYAILVPVTAEFTASTPVSSGKFRAICDRYKTKEEILAALKN
jgi:hypothetical protein